MKEIRTFIAIPISTPVRRHAKKLVQDLQLAGDGVGWVPLEHLHLTLKFLGEVENNRIAEVCQIARQCCGPTPQTRVHFAGIDAFPHMRRPRVIHASIARGGPVLAELVSRLEQAYATVGFKPEPRDWRPHLTLGRVRRRGKSIDALRDRMKPHCDVDLGDMLVDTVQVYASFLDKRGPTYNVMDTIVLQPTDDAT